MHASEHSVCPPFGVLIQVKQCSETKKLERFLKRARSALRSVYESQPQTLSSGQRERAAMGWLKEVELLCAGDDMLANADDYGTQVRDFIAQIALRFEIAFLRSYRPAKGGEGATKIDPISKKLRKQIDGIVMRVSLLLDPHTPLQKVRSDCSNTCPCTHGLSFML